MTHLTADYYAFLQLTLITFKGHDLLLDCNKYKSDAVRVANFCRNNGYDAMIYTMPGMIYFVKVFFKV